MKFNLNSTTRGPVQSERLPCGHGTPMQAADRCMACDLEEARAEADALKQRIEHLQVCVEATIHQSNPMEWFAGQRDAARKEADALRKELEGERDNAEYYRIQYAARTQAAEHTATRYREALKRNREALKRIERLRGVEAAPMSSDRELRDEMIEIAREARNENPDPEEGS